MVDKILLFRKLSDLDQYFEQIREYKSLTGIFRRLENTENYRENTSINDRNMCRYCKSYHL